MSIPSFLADSLELQFFVAGNPKGQPRPRAFSRGGKAHVFDPGTAEGWKSEVAKAAKEAWPACGVITAFNGPVRVRLEFGFARPKNHYRKSGLRADAPLFHTAKPDADNAAKAVLDALTILKIWKDDSQVASLTVTKKYSEPPGVVIIIRELTE